MNPEHISTIIQRVLAKEEMVYLCQLFNAQACFIEKTIVKPPHLKEGGFDADMINERPWHKSKNNKWRQ